MLAIVVGLMHLSSFNLKCRSVVVILMTFQVIGCHNLLQQSTPENKMPEPEIFSPDCQAEHKRTKIRYRAAAVFHLLMAVLAAHGME